jgi:hypothetical protein
MLGVIFIASILIIPIFLAMGYVFRIIKSTLVGIDELPDFDEIGDMFIDGLKIFVVGIVYSIPIWIIYGIIFVLGLGMITAYGDAVTSSTAFGLMAVIYIVLIIVAFIVGLFELMAIANMAYYNRRFRSSFQIQRNIRTYIQHWLGKIHRHHDCNRHNQWNWIPHRMANHVHLHWIHTITLDK